MPALKEAYSSQEVAVFLGITQQAVDKRARGVWKSKPRQGRGGGHDWLFSSMPQETQLAIRIAEERQAIAACEGIFPPATLDQHAVNTARSKTVVDEKRRRKAMAKSDLLRLFLAWQRKHGFTKAQKNAFILAYQGGAWAEILQVLGPKISWKSLERWKLQQTRDDGVLTLADKRGFCHRGRSNLTEQHRLIILGHVLNPNAPGVGECARKIQQRCKAEGLWIPSDATVRRFVQAYAEECFDEWTLWREGKKAWNDKCAISLLRDWNLIEVGDVVIADGHTLNFETLDPETGKPKRMTLLLFYDGASNHPLGWEVMATENVACISAAFRRTCLVLGKFPLVVYLDNGKAFRAKFFKGVSDFRQAGFLGLYGDLGCEVIHAWPYHGQSKPIERFFGTFHEMEVFVPSYTGNSIDRKPARMKRGEDLHRQLYDKMGGRPLTMEETHTAIAMWFCEYANRHQFRTHLQGRTPAEVFQAGVGPGVDADRLTLMMLQKEIKTISKDGIRHLGRLYWHEALSSRRHSVLVRYDDQLSPHTVFVYDTHGNFICEARDREHYKIASGLHPAARVLGTAEQQQDLSDAIELKRGQEKLAGANLRHMLNAVVLPEAQKMQAGIMQAEAAKRAPLPAAPRGKKLTAAEIAVIDAAAEKARADFDTNSHQKSTYKPAALMRFKDELAKYEYLFTQKHQHGAELVADDEAWMAVFEATPNFERNCKRRYDMLLEVFIMQRQAS
jgi:putative transposase